MNNVAEALNILGNFCGKRDIAELTSEQLQDKYGIKQADVLVLFGGSIIYGGDVLAEAMKNGVAKKYIIVGGVGHTTEALRKKFRKEMPQLDVDDLSEAEIFKNYLKLKYKLEPDLLECKSTNCGNNITYLLDLLKESGLIYESIILLQDSTMQRRMEAGLRKYIDKNIDIINYAVYSVNVVVKNGRLSFERPILGMWDLEKYMSLLMGEIQRLSDNENGYGPKGKNFIEHVEIPAEVKKAYDELCVNYANLVRKANPLYASNEVC
ncbi:TPA: YdcF family protein [Enterococcus faecalis]|uniref:YdcF family protein n=1 Tax=Enterococcus faecalis TaxID=1351 RepID=UPI001924737D|nr:YdcF family protein [Enterococcus faecalis]EGO8500349.1 YdcF family protein [Enterococcus faecalis]EIQ7100181.1 YdcF family protein [Enterococcus faecalis]MDK7898396.1 YdcF family protein [Enterococcus faecalis]HAP5878362.1 YdcF family protein [Enterococcus faecalis]HBE2154479.1 YdcF family protein [Enterococcus faecalis]